MKVKNILITFTVVIFAMILCSCANEIKRTAIDSRCTEPYSEVVTEYKHEYSWIKGEFVLVPNIHTKTHPAKYELLYLIEYDDGTSLEVWREVEYRTYMTFKGGAT